MNANEKKTLLKQVAIGCIFWFPVAALLSNWMVLHMFFIFIFLLGGLPYLISRKKKTFLLPVLLSVFVSAIATVVFQSSLIESGISGILPRLMGA